MAREDSLSPLFGQTPQYALRLRPAWLNVKTESFAVNFVERSGKVLLSSRYSYRLRSQIDGLVIFCFKGGLKCEGLLIPQMVSDE